jgi:hypothetical protein
MISRSSGCCETALQTMEYQTTSSYVTGIDIEPYKNLSPGQKVIITIYFTSNLTITLDVGYIISVDGVPTVRSTVSLPPYATNYPLKIAYTIPNWASLSKHLVCADSLCIQLSMAEVTAKKSYLPYVATALGIVAALSIAGYAVSKKR